MNRFENLMITTMEECNELSMSISKALRFGVSGSHCETGVSNNYAIMEEYIQLKTMMAILIEKGILKELEDEIIMGIEAQKRYKVTKYQKLSKQMGLIDD